MMSSGIPHITLPYIQHNVVEIPFKALLLFIWSQVFVPVSLLACFFACVSVYTSILFWVWHIDVWEEFFCGLCLCCCAWRTVWCHRGATYPEAVLLQQFTGLCVFRVGPSLQPINQKLWLWLFPACLWLTCCLRVEAVCNIPLYHVGLGNFADIILTSMSSCATVCWYPMGTLLSWRRSFLAGGGGWGLFRPFSESVS